MEKFNIEQYEPKFEHRFVVTFPEHHDIKSWAVQKINLPKITSNGWGNIEIEFLDTIQKSTAKSLFKFPKSYFSNEENKILFKFTIELLDPVGASVEIWEISVAEILEINFGDLTYRNDDVITLKLIVKPFNCVLI